VIDATARALKQFEESEISATDHDRAMCILVQVWEYGTELFMAVSKHQEGIDKLRALIAAK